MTTVLDTIIAKKLETVAHAKQYRPLSDLHATIKTLPPPRPFAQSLREDAEKKGHAVIAEIKKASPSQGVIRETFDAIAIANDYQSHGASALSVLTDAPFFQGSLEDLQAVYQAVNLPLLRKDFMVDDYQIVEARAFGAAAILLIVAALNDAQLQKLWQCAMAYGLCVLVEVHNSAELDRALALPLNDQTLIGVNNRDLKTFSVSLDKIVHLHPRIPRAQIGICESGIQHREAVSMLKEKGINTFLIGEAFMRVDSPGAALQAFFQN